MRRALALSGCLAAGILSGVNTAEAHFGMLIPSTPIADQHHKSIDLSLSFSHPFEQIGMELTQPARFFVVNDGSETDLRDSLQQTEVMGHTGWRTSFAFKRPGVYQFAMEPLPYWEPAEDLFIIHYTKTIVAAFGDDVGWDEPIGLPTEIVPLLRPFGNYAGNAFSGQVLLNGAPVPHAEVEVEYYNDGGVFQAPSDYHVTQVIKADADGVFSFTCPLAGWWGFAALNEADYMLKTPAGEEKGVEIGAVLWIHLDEFRRP